jgi:hypothetical protein
MNSRFTDDSLSWRKLCRAAALERDPDKLSHIVQKMSSGLRARQRSLRRFPDTLRQTLPHIAASLHRAA